MRSDLGLRSGEGSGVNTVWKVMPDTVVALTVGLGLGLRSRDDFRVAPFTVGAR